MCLLIGDNNFMMVEWVKKSIRTKQSVCLLGISCILLLEKAAVLVISLIFSLSDLMNKKCLHLALLTALSSFYAR
jgi:hypothetical protein